MASRETASPIIDSAKGESLIAVRPKSQRVNKRPSTTTAEVTTTTTTTTATAAPETIATTIRATISNVVGTLHQKTEPNGNNQDMAVKAPPAMITKTTTNTTKQQLKLIYNI